MERAEARTIPRSLAVGGAFAGLALVGAVDYATGVELRVYPLYFVPLALGAWALGRRGAVVLALLATVLWFVTNRAAGLQYSATWVWAANTVAQGTAFLTVSLLIAWLRGLLDREQLLARTDRLTGLPNVRGFEEAVTGLVAAARRHGRPLTLAYIDIDHFKSVNDRLGHAAGDAVLSSAAAALRGALRGSDVAGRLGGDEFALCLPDTALDPAQTLLERVHQVLVDALRAHDPALSASIGAVAWAGAPPDLADLVASADRLMYEVKRGGKGCVRVQAAPA